MAFYKREVRGICSDAAFEFSAATLPIDPSKTFLRFSSDRHVSAWKFGYKIGKFSQLRKYYDEMKGHKAEPFISKRKEAYGLLPDRIIRGKLSPKAITDMSLVHLAAHYTAFSSGRKIVFEKISGSRGSALLKFFQNSNLRLSLKTQISLLSNERKWATHNKKFKKEE